MENIAVIDMGTNSMRLMISELEGNQIMNRYKTLETTRMGQGIDQSGKIRPEVIERNFNALKGFKEQADAKGVQKIVVFATSALRDASNKADFIKKVKDELGLSIHILSGEQEAEIGFKGVISEMTAETLLVIDIGGGSTEFILGNKEKGIVDLISINMGALRMTEKYIHQDPIKEEDMAALKKGIEEMLLPIVQRIPLQNNICVAGIGGTITTLAAIKQNMKEYDWRKIHHSILSIEDIQQTLQHLSQMNLEERKKVRGLQPNRADIIIAGTIILRCIMEILGITNLVVSESDNLEGMLYEYLEDRR